MMANWWGSRSPGTGPLAEKSWTAACSQGHWSHSSCCPDVERILPASSLASGAPWCTVKRRGRDYLLGGDTEEDVGRTPVLAQPYPTKTPHHLSTPPLSTHTHTHTHTQLALIPKGKKAGILRRGWVGDIEVRNSSQEQFKRLQESWIISQLLLFMNHKLEVTSFFFSFRAQKCR